MSQEPSALLKIQTYRNNVFNRLDDIETDPNADLSAQEYSYHVGALHAFDDSIGLINNEAGSNAGGMSNKKKVAIVVGVAGVAYMAYPAVKIKARKLRESLRESAHRGRRFRERNAERAFTS